MRWGRWMRTLARLPAAVLLAVGVFLGVFLYADELRGLGAEVLGAFSGHAVGHALTRWWRELEPVEMALGAAGFVLTFGSSWAWRARPRGPAPPAGDRRRVAILLRQNLDLLERLLDWRPGDFTDLAVTLEAVRRPRGRWNPLAHRTALTFQARSLTKALESEPSRFILLQGPPGAGKSVAMRHYARTLLARAERSPAGGPLPLWVNLRDFHVPGGTPTVDDLRAYLAEQVNPSGAPELDAYLRAELPRDLATGRVVLLLDSFDEIPAILGSSHIDSEVQRYLGVIVGFAGGGGARCVIAAREYKAPRPDWFTRLEITGLQYAEQLSLLRSAGLTSEQLVAVEPLLRDPRAGFAADLRNPLHLSLLAAYLKAHDAMPDRPSALFAHYVRTQLRHPLGPEEVPSLEDALAAYAFELLGSASTGLAGGTAELEAHIAAAAPEGAAARLTDAALRSALLVRTSARPDAGIAFVHRRVQEYLATRYVLAQPDALDADELVLGGRWRETTVALLHLSRRTEPLHARLEQVLTEELDAARAAAEFAWSGRAIHVLELLVSAYRTRPDGLPPGIASRLGALVELGWRRGGIGDRRLALDCLPVVPPELRHTMVTETFAGPSHWLRRSVLRDCAALTPLPEPVDTAIRRLLITLVSGGMLRREATALDSDLRRLYGRQDLVRARAVLALLPRVVGVATLAVLVITAMIASGAPPMAIEAPVIWTALSVGAVLFWLFGGPFGFWELQFAFSYSRGSRLRNYFAPAFGGPEAVTKNPGDTTGFLRMWSPVTAVYLVVTGAMVLQGGYPAAGLLVIVVGVLAPVAVLWAVSFLVRFHEGGFSRRLRVAEILVPFSVPGLRGRLPAAGRDAAEIVALLRSAGRRGILGGLGYLLLYLGGLVLVVLAFGLFLALMMLLIDNTVGADLALVLMGVLFGGPIAFFAGWGLYRAGRRAVRETRSWLRYRREVGRVTELTPDTALAFILRNPDPLDVADFLRRVRTGRFPSAGPLPRGLVRDLIDLIEAATGARPAGRDPHASLRTALAEGRLSPATLRSWSADVLDELGRIDQSLRER